MSSDHYNVDECFECKREDCICPSEKPQEEVEQLPHEKSELVQQVLNAETFLVRIGKTGTNAALTLSPDAIEKLLSGQMFPFEIPISFGKGKHKQHKKVTINVMLNNSFCLFYDQFASINKKAKDNILQQIKGEQSAVDLGQSLVDDKVSKIIT